MIRLLLSLVFTVITLTVLATDTLTAAADSISMGPGYANQVWYKPGTPPTASPQSSWHLGFQAGQSGTILVNDGLANLRVYLVPGSTAADYETTTDTSAIADSNRLYNKPASWTGALNTVADPKNILDYGWGAYNVATHKLRGTRVYLVATPDGVVWKLLIESWENYTYKIKYAHLDGSEPHTGEIIMNGFAPKEFIYWSFTDHASVDLEPVIGMWELTFLKYTDLVPVGPGTPPLLYPVVGVLAAPGIKLAKVMGADPSTLAPPPASQFDSAANLIGWDWKTFDQTTGKYTIADSTAYFVMRRDGSMWRMIMTGYGGNTTGVINFNVEAVVTSVSEDQASNVNVVGVHPNVVSSSNTVTIVLNAARHIESATIVDITGRTVRNIASNLDAGMYALPVSTTGLAVGHYTVVVQTATGAVTTALIVH